ncbi:carboxylating nicotinate-nucleotide diphosphorylase [Advenella sp. FME57]|uniref:carboxylating nicotinate-nucleotide diphosphorylase n=1 Tax=Advenella sp. FME57 TaxID=2742604 RepID=UPI0018683400|nr:carboxylating nicotinate-nucleotide diphosphorylase [Advenella sp. FME57]
MNPAAHELPDVVLLPFVQAALAEDMGRKGDITSQATIPAGKQGRLHLVSRRPGVIAGMALARLAFAQIDPAIKVDIVRQDGAHVEAGQLLATVSGDIRSMLAAERTALNFLTHLSGIATQTADIVKLVADTNARITCTRKTIPGLRVLQKYAVRVGGGWNHRMALDDAMLIKDNHIALAGDLRTAIAQAHAHAGHLTPVELEVDTLEQLAVALEEGVRLVLLDNMDCDTLRRAVAMCQGKAQTEASGGITPETVQAVAQTGVDYIAIGYLTHSTKALDIGLDFQV